MELQPLPIILGSELSGIVEAIGPEVLGFKLADEVYGATNVWNVRGTAAIEPWGKLTKAGFALNCRACLRYYCRYESAACLDQERQTLEPYRNCPQRGEVVRRYSARGSFDRAV